MKSVHNISEISDRKLLELVFANQLNIINTLEYHEFLIRNANALKDQSASNDSLETTKTLKKAIGFLGLFNDRLHQNAFEKDALKTDDTGHLTIKG